MNDEAVAGLVSVVRSVVAAGHYENRPEGLFACDALDTNPGPCNCGWVEAKAALADWSRSREQET